MIHPIDLKYYALTLLDEERKKKAAALGAVAQAQAPSYQWVYPALFFGAVAAMMYFSSKDSKHSNPVTPLPKDEADPEELSKGSLVELEHTDDEDEAERIALQHLAEDPHYYSKLETVFPEHQNPYTVTDRMKRNARDSYALGIIKIDPLDFLKLTAENPDRIFEENKERNLKYQDYEDFGLKDEILVHPFLEIRPDYSDGWSVGWITGHEGRHRAAAAYMEGEDFYCYIIPSPLDKTQKLKDAVMSGEGLKFIPKVLKNQFRDLGEIVEVRVKKSAIRQNPRSVMARKLISEEDKIAVKELYEDGFSLEDIAEALGVSAGLVRIVLFETGTPIRKSPGRQPIKLDVEKIVRLYGEGLTGEEIAAQFGVSMGLIHSRLIKEGVQIRGWQNKDLYPDISDEEIKVLYLQGLSLNKIAEKFGVTNTMVRNRLTRMGVERRHNDVDIPDEEIKVLYLQGLSASEIAEKFDVSSTLVLKRLKKMGVEPRSIEVDIPEEEIKVLYLQGLSLKKIAEKFGVSEGTIRNRLEKMGIARRTSESFETPLDNEEIKVLYLQGLSLNKIAERLGTTNTVVRNRLKRMGVERRHNDVNVPEDEIKVLYLQGLSAREIAKRFGTSDLVVLRRLKKMGVERRPAHRRRKNPIGQNPNFPEIRELISKMKQKEIKAEIKELLSGGGTFGDLTSNQKTYFVLLFNELQRRRREKKLKQNPIPPAAVAREAREGLELRASVAPSKRGGTSVGLARAKQLSNRQNISDNTMKRMRSFFARHEVDKKAKGFRRGEKGYPSKGLQAWKLWGGDAGKRWVKKS